MARVKPSATAMLMGRAKTRQAEGKDIVSLAAGEPDFDTPEAIKTAAKTAINEGVTKYTPVDGDALLKQAIVDKYERENGLTYETSTMPC